MNTFLTKSDIFKRVLNKPIKIANCNCGHFCIISLPFLSYFVTDRLSNLIPRRRNLTSASVILPFRRHYVFRRLSGKIRPGTSKSLIPRPGPPGNGESVDNTPPINTAIILTSYTIQGYLFLPTGTKMLELQMSSVSAEI